MPATRFAEPRLRHIRGQYAVGQGFFHAGYLFSNEQSVFSYVFDCGSNDRDALERAVVQDDERRSGRDIDVLFLSHLHRDHVNGLDLLLALKKAKTVVLPYLTKRELLLLALETLEDGPPSADYFGMLSDLPGWFGGRGTERIVSVLPKGRLNLDALVTQDVVVTAQTIELAEELFADPHHLVRQLPIRGTDGISLFRIGHSVPFAIESKRQTYLNWFFATYVHGGTDQNTQDAIFSEVLPEGSLAEGWDMEDETDWLIKLLRDPQKRRKLIECYRAHKGDLNWTSLSIFSGPVTRTGRFCGVAHVYDYTGELKLRVSAAPRASRRRELLSQGKNLDRLSSFGVSVGWVVTGDADLRTDSRRQPFISHFGDLLSRETSTFVLPHHGSYGSFHPELVLEGVPFYVASASRSNQYGHPHTIVHDLVHRSGHVLVTTTENPASMFLEEAEIVCTNGRAISIKEYMDDDRFESTELLIEL